MADAASRLKEHPILSLHGEATVPFRFGERELTARPGEVISSALFAAGIHLFGTHPKDQGPQGIFCANGQCGQCLVLANGRPVKACMTPVRPGMVVEPASGDPSLPPADHVDFDQGLDVPPVKVVTVLIVGGGPAGLSAAAELGQLGIDTLVIDDKDELGGKLTLQTHPFFGSMRDCWAGTRGIDIAQILADQLGRLHSVELWLSATAVGLFRDRRVGVVREGRYLLVEPKHLLLATGARERTLAFPGSDLPGVYGAGAFQTLVNRDQIRTAERLLVVGGGNVGLIAAYHALQAGIDVVGLVEALPEVGGYKVHLDKLKRLGVPVWTSHTVVAAEGDQHVESVTVAPVDEHFRAQPEGVRRFAVDTVLVAVGLASVDELVATAESYGMAVTTAGDANEIAEASAAIFGGKIAGRQVAQALGRNVDVPPEWEQTAAVLRSRPGRVGDHQLSPPPALALYPLIRCIQPIPCNPCTEVCPVGSIATADGTIMGLPQFDGSCLGCGRCVSICPALAIVLVDERYDPSQQRALVLLPWELPLRGLEPGALVKTTGFRGEEIGKGQVVGYRFRRDQDRRVLLALDVPFRERHLVAGLRYRDEVAGETALLPEESDPLVCRCSRVRRSDIMAHIQAGVRDINALKAVIRTGMGPCGGKVCTDEISRIFKQMGVDSKEVTPPTVRPFAAEFPLHVYAGLSDEEGRS
jgi:NADPH-dependent 2,4-dienoyl-CoA reductase/sulfur reductase-like enzyme/Pyruvate/2-oxoacid:ferredoxin oxidoreductase delta subunit